MADEDGSADSVWVTYLHPFAVVRPDAEPTFKIPLDQINAGTYDQGQLCKIVTSLSLKPTSDFDLLVCLDGALALPRKGAFATSDAALDRFNFVLAALLIGGIRTEAVDTRDIVLGNLRDSASIWPVELGNSLNSHLHGLLRQRLASSFDNIRLSGPKNIVVSEFLAAFAQGQRVFEAVSNLTPTFLLRGFTELQYHNWSNCLGSLWVSVEQLTDFLWRHRFLLDSSRNLEGMKERNASLREDNRTWSVAVRQEILWQTGVIDETTYRGLYPARRARNDLVHVGRIPTTKTVVSLAESTARLLEIASNSNNLGIRNVIKSGEEQQET
jgi:hypothetical protein